jgi:hypothetical protein
LPYCRKCGSKLDEDAKFCRVCGAPVEVASAEAISQTPHAQRKSPATFVLVGLLVGIILLASFAFLFFAPVKAVNFSQSVSAPSRAGVSALTLVFDADTADVTVLPYHNYGLVAVNVTASGSVGVFGDAQNPVQVNLTEHMAGSTLEVTSCVSMRDHSFNTLHVECRVHVDPTVPLNLTVRTITGTVHMSNTGPAKFDALTLQSTTGSTIANMYRGTVFRGDVSISTTTGTSQIQWENAKVDRNISVRVTTTTGSANAYVTEEGDLGGNVTMSLTTATGAINSNMHLYDDVGVRVTSQVGTGNIYVTTQSFNGNKSPLQSSNYPAKSNFLVYQKTNTGGISINSIYDTRIIEERIRDDTINHITGIHHEVAPFTENLNWTGGRTNPQDVTPGIYSYFASGWNVTIRSAVSPDAVYTIEARYVSPQIGVPYSITWRGIYQAGVVIENEYQFAQ